MLSLLCWLCAKCIKFGLCVCRSRAQKCWHKDLTSCWVFCLERACAQSYKDKKDNRFCLSISLLSCSTVCIKYIETTSNLMTFNINCKFSWNVNTCPCQSSLNTTLFDENLITQSLWHNRVSLHHLETQRAGFKRQKCNKTQKKTTF